MQANEFELDKVVTIDLGSGKTVQGVLKGINKGCDDKVTACVEYMIPTRNNFELDKLS